jgi:hypothetical protein
MRYRKLGTATAAHEDAERDICIRQRCIALHTRITEHKCNTKMGDIYSRVQ